MEDWHFYIFGFVFFAMSAGGFTKGVVGIGLPLTAVSIMSFLIGPPVPVALMPIPILLTNVWQAFYGGYLMQSLQRFWPVLICLPLGTILGVKVLAEAEKTLLSFLLGCSILVFALFACHVWLPAGDRPVTALWPGILATVLFWFAGASLFAMYLENFADYGATFAGLAGIMTAQIFLYLMAVTVILGGELNAAILKMRTEEKESAG